MFAPLKLKVKNEKLKINTIYLRFKLAEEKVFVKQNYIGIPTINSINHKTA